MFLAIMNDSYLNLQLAILKENLHHLDQDVDELKILFFSLLNLLKSLIVYPLKCLSCYWLIKMLVVS